MTDFETIVRSKGFTNGIIVVGLLLAALVIFQAGVYVGVHNASFSFRMGDNYYRALGPGSPLRGPLGEELSESNGAAGKILSVSLPTFLMDDGMNGEKVILVSDQTVVRLLRDATTSGAIKPDYSAIVIGNPNDKGEIEATLVRLLPPVPDGAPLWVSSP